jgi:murein DD-endopeptidase MepM/ murein hydrolase activator NlpD
MQLMTDLRFVLSLYKNIEGHLRHMVHGVLVLIFLPPLVLSCLVGFGVFAPQGTSAAVETHRVDPRPTVSTAKKIVPDPIPTPPATVWPARGPITAAFGSQTPAQLHHSGMDIGGKYGDPIYAFKPGKVIVTETRNVNPLGLGKYVVIDHGNGLWSYYGHLSAITTTVGQQVTTQAVIGKEGATGEAYGVHLHFELHLNGKAINPAQYLIGVPPRP